MNTLLSKVVSTAANFSHPFGVLATHNKDQIIKEQQIIWYENRPLASHCTQMRQSDT
ncbi:hypothetical protein SAMN02745181_2570 [Rubritalea squalenifaciens DSM 18772]|uniref:Uncharacterized protein n=2 Tax=Rubritalea TaxID=361050 RepID=A0A1M6M1I9_9BACT|nr:hypothetical protein SAMN02745181_2570 [Rubritalea squalenifaciens DSM 18772]